MSNKTLRFIMRWVHIIGGSILAAFIYSSSLREIDAFVLLAQVVVVPGLILSGVIMWQQPRVGKLLKRFSAQRAG